MKSGVVGCRGGGEVGMGVVEWVGEWMHAVVWSFQIGRAHV